MRESSLRRLASLLFPALLAACGSGATPADSGANDATGIDAAADTATDVVNDFNDVAITDASDTNAPGDATDTPDAPDAGLPDLLVDEQALRDYTQFTAKYFRADACEIAEGCVAAPGWRRLLMFTTETPNLGDADLDLGSAADNNPNFEYSACHNHYHFRGYADYSLLGADGGLAALGHKQSFCVEDLFQVVDAPGIRTTPQFDSCGESGDRQGISRGWADDYYADLPCQWIDVTDVPPGRYTLRVEINTARGFAESDYTNNTAEVTVTIPSDFSLENPLQPCDISDAQGVGRNCGWVNEGSFDCNPGDTVAVGCSAACGLGSCEGSYDLRVCEGNTPCTGGDLNRVLQQDFGECSTGHFDLASTCPLARFVCPPSGRYTVLGAPDTNGDTASTCTLATRVEQFADGGIPADAAADVAGD